MQVRTGTFAGLVAMAVAWALIWAFPGGVIEAIDNVTPAAHGFTRRLDMWMQTLAIPGLIGGVIFSALLMATEGRRSVAELSLGKSAAWGAVAGALTGAVVVWLLYTGLSSGWQSAAAATAVATVLGTISGVAAPLGFRLLGARRASASS